MVWNKLSELFAKILQLLKFGCFVFSIIQCSKMDFFETFKITSVIAKTGKIEVKKLMNSPNLIFNSIVDDFDNLKFSLFFYFL